MTKLSDITELFRMVKARSDWRDSLRSATPSDKKIKLTFKIAKCKVMYTRVLWLVYYLQKREFGVTTILRSCYLTAWLQAEKQTGCCWLLRSEEQGRNVMELHELTSQLHHPFQDLLKEGIGTRVAGLSKRKMDSHKVQESPQKMVSVETERCVKPKIYCSCCTWWACQKQMRWKLRVDVISGLSRTK